MECWRRSQSLSSRRNYLFQDRLSQRHLYQRRTTTGLHRSRWLCKVRCWKQWRRHLYLRYFDLRQGSNFKLRCRIHWRWQALWISKWGLRIRTRAQSRVFRLRVLNHNSSQMSWPNQMIGHSQLAKRYWMRKCCPRGSWLLWRARLWV